MAENEYLLSYTLRLGERLRAVRRRLGFTLEDVQARSNEDYRATTLGAYERGERMISVPRLHRLAQLYNVPIAELLPRESSEATAEERGNDSTPGHSGGKLTLDLTQLARQKVLEQSVLGSYVRALQRERQDFNGQVITLRDDDVRILAGVLSLSVDQFRRQLEEQGVTR